MFGDWAEVGVTLAWFGVGMGWEGLWCAMVVCGSCEGRYVGLLWDVCPGFREGALGGCGGLGAMICPYCNSNDDKVIDSRASEAGRVIRRRRQCLSCGKRFTTYERIEETARLVVIKRDGSRAPFSRESIMKGVRLACGKRPVPEEEKLRIVDEVEDAVHRGFDREVQSREIGEMVAERLRDLDDIAYVRFASEYYQFKSVGDIMAQLEELTERVRDVKDQGKLFEEGGGGGRDGAAKRGGGGAADGGGA